ncbi:hypothetical protein OIV83_001529 [Microbotryomycetes sp. JL201]|nr:hypothetical protein OIV83_001529 [Microbotryomycetes sp. JL201]
MSTSSSPPQSAVSSTPATSTPAVAPGDKMQVDGSDSSDVELMQATTPVPKRKSAASDSSKTAKKAKLDLSSAKKTVAPPDKGAAPLVELKKGKLVAKQKAIKLDQALGALRLRIDFTEWGCEILTDSSAKIDEIPSAHHGMVALLVQESTQTLAGLLTSTKNALIDCFKTSSIGIDDHETVAEVKPLSERFPSGPIKSLIQEIATRRNYGIDKADLPDGLVENDKEVPSNLELWFWEVNDLELLPADCRINVEKRKTEREQMKVAAVDLFLGLSSDEQKELLSGKSSKSNAKAPAARSSSGATASGSGSKSSTSKPKVKTEAQLAKDAAKAKEKEDKENARLERERLKAEKEAEKAEKKAEREAKQAEKDAEKAAKDAKKAEREAKRVKKAADEEKRQALMSKQKTIMSGFFVKKSSTPPVEVATATPKTSDFTRTFLPFHVRADVTVAPVNRFTKAEKGKTVAVQINSDDKLTVQDSLRSFLKDVPKDRIPPYNPHPVPSVSVRAAVTAIQESQLTGLDSTAYVRDLKDWRKVRVKLLKFHEDVRPGYVGTWTKTSKTIGPRTPFDQDQALLNYDVDSEAEWEEEVEDADAEDLKSGGEDSDDDGAESEPLSDDWMCGDDEIEFEAGYTEEGDVSAVGLDADATKTGNEDETAAARQRVLDRERKSKAIKDGSKKKRLVGPLVPIVKGPSWEDKIGHVSYAPFSSMRVQLLNDSNVALMVPAGKENDRVGATRSGKDDDGPKKKRQFPPDRMVEFLRNILASSSPNRNMLQEEIGEKMRGGKGDQRITKAMVNELIKLVNPENLKKTADDVAKWDLSSAVKYGL